MRHKVLVLVLLLAATACANQSATVPSAANHVADEQYVTVGAQSEPGSPTGVIHITTLLADRAAGTGLAYDFPSDVAIYRRKTRTGREMLELHGKSGATFLELKNVRTLERRDRYDTSSVLDPASLPVRPMFSAHSPQCTVIPWSAPGGNIQIAGCGGSDPGLCTDCSGPLAPGGNISCHYTSDCGGDPSLGTGRGIGIFRLVSPQISCYFSFVDSSYSCDTDGIDNTDSQAPRDYSLGYEYNYTLAAAVLHCAGPTETSEAFLAGKTPDAAINLGFARVPAGAAKGWVMHTAYTSNTAISGVYFSFRFPPSLNGTCTGAN